MAESEDIFLSVVNENRIIEDLLKETNDGLSKEVESMETEGEAKSRSAAKKLTEFPLSRIRTIMKMDPDVHIASQEAVYLVTKATVRKQRSRCGFNGLFFRSCSWGRSLRRLVNIRRRRSGRRSRGEIWITSSRIWTRCVSSRALWIEAEPSEMRNIFLTCLIVLVFTK